MHSNKSLFFELLFEANNNNNLHDFNSVNKDETILNASIQLNH